MWSRDLVAIAVTLGVTIASSVPIGHYVARVFRGQRTWLDPLCGPIERLLLCCFVWCGTRRPGRPTRGRCWSRTRDVAGRLDDRDARRAGCR